MTDRPSLWPKHFIASQRLKKNRVGVIFDPLGFCRRGVYTIHLTRSKAYMLYDFFMASRRSNCPP